MAKIFIEPSKARATLSQQQALERALRALSQDVGNVRSGLLYKISGREAIDARLREAAGQLSREAESAKAMRLGLEQIINRYEQTEKGNTERVKAEKTSIQNGGNGGGETVTPSPSIWTDWLDWLFPGPIAPFVPIPLIPSPIAPISLILSILTPITPSPLLLAGISILNVATTGNSHTNASWLGYEFADGYPGVTAWLGKASAETRGDWGSAEVNAYLGKVEAKAEADAHFMSTEAKKKYVDGKWTETETFSVIDASAGVSASGSILAADGKAEAGNDYLGAEVSAEGGVGNATAEAKGEFSIGEDGVSANVSGKAMVSAVEGKASGTINILGIEITGKVGGYAGAAGVEGKIGIEDNKFVMEGGFAALLGISGGVEIGFNDTGWNEFVDWITFWD